MSDDGDDDVGYGRPPKNGQFKKGQSGNPGGRPRKAKKSESGASHSAGLLPIDRMMLDEGKRVIKIREGDHSYDLTQSQAVIRTAHAKALKGSPMAMRTIIYESQRAQAREQANRQAVWDSYVEYVAQCRAELADAARHGRPAPVQIPHPDDIEFDDALGAVFLAGPGNEKERQIQVARALLRDMTLALWAYSDTFPQPKMNDEEFNMFGLMSALLNRGLPSSLRQSDQDYDREGIRLFGLNRRALAQHIAKISRELKCDPSIWLRIGRRRAVLSFHTIGMRNIQGVFVAERGWSLAKVRDRLWNAVPVERLTSDQLDLLLALKMAPPPAHVSRARKAIAERERRGETT